MLTHSAIWKVAVDLFLQTHVALLQDCRCLHNALRYALCLAQAACMLYGLGTVMGAVLLLFFRGVCPCPLSWGCRVRCMSTERGLWGREGCW